MRSGTTPARKQYVVPAPAETARRTVAEAGVPSQDGASRSTRSHQAHTNPAHAMDGPTPQAATTRRSEFRFYYFTPRYEQTVAFYRDLLGFEVYNSWDRDGDRGTIFRSPDGNGLIEIEDGPVMPSIAGGVYIEVEDVDAWYERVRASGAPIASELASTGYGHRNFKTKDPSGLEVAFFRYVVVPPGAGAAG